MAASAFSCLPPTVQVDATTMCPSPLPPPIPLPPSGTSAVTHRWLGRTHALFSLPINDDTPSTHDKAHQPRIQKKQKIGAPPTRSFKCFNSHGNSGGPSTQRKGAFGNVQGFQPKKFTGPPAGASKDGNGETHRKKNVWGGCKESGMRMNEKRWKC